MMKTPDDSIEEFKTTVHKQLNASVEVFNNFLRMWEERHGCQATFSFRFNPEGKSILAIRDIVLPVFKEGVTEEQIKSAEDILSKAEDTAIIS